MASNEIARLCEAPAGTKVVLQGNMATAVGTVRAGLHAADGYPGTPSTELIDKGLSNVQDHITVGWDVNEAVAAGVGVGHTMAGRDVLVTMKIPGLFQAGDIFSSAAFFKNRRGALVYYIATDFTPSSTQHLIDPRYFFKSCMTPVLEPVTHQQMLEAPGYAAELSRKFNTPVVILASGTLCHSEGLVELNAVTTREPAQVDNIKEFFVMPGDARANYNHVLANRVPQLEAFVEGSSWNQWIKGSGKKGVIVSGANVMFAEEVKAFYGADIDILSLGVTNPLPAKLIADFVKSVDEVYVIEDAYRYLTDEIAIMGLNVQGKDRYDSITEWSPALLAAKMGLDVAKLQSVDVTPVRRPPMICAGCPYRIFGELVNTFKKRGKIETCFGDIGCNTLLRFMNALDTNVAMGASESTRLGYVLSLPEKASKCLSILGDSTEAHSGLDATRNTVFRNGAGVKVILDNYWTAMTGAQPAPTSPINLAGEPVKFDLVKAIEGTGCKAVVINAYDRAAVKKGMEEALEAAANGEFIVLILRGACLQRVPAKQKVMQLEVDPAKCKKCYACMVCPGLEKGPDGVPVFNNLCSGCGGEMPTCAQYCAPKAMIPCTGAGQACAPEVVLPEPPVPAENVPFDIAQAPEKLSVAIRGVGGQGNLFFGKVLTQLAFMAGYSERNIIKGETHGMAQMGGPVISTFGAGKIYSPVFMPQSVDCLVCMEESEVLRDGFLGMLREGGTVLLARTRILPAGMDEAEYPSIEKIREALKGYKVVEVDVLSKALELGDPTGRIANVVTMGVLSKLPPFDKFPEELWFKALYSINSKPAIWKANYAAFMSGRGIA